MRLFILTICCLIFSGCGQKGPLYVATSTQLQEMADRKERIRLKKIARATDQSNLKNTEK